jgi:hypothetical protein
MDICMLNGYSHERKGGIYYAAHTGRLLGYSMMEIEIGPRDDITMTEV